MALADGTRIKINSDSKLTFPHRFMGEERRVRLEGEALFDVVKDKEHPFIVETAKGNVQVLGTLFDINVYPEEDVVQTTLSRVGLSLRGGDVATCGIVTRRASDIQYEKRRVACRESKY